MQSAGHGIADVVELAGRCSGDGRHVGRPPPARLVDGVADDRLIEPQDAGMAVGEVANLRGRLDAPGLQSWHVTRVPARHEETPPVDDQRRLGTWVRAR